MTTQERVARLLSDLRILLIVADMRPFLLITAADLLERQHSEWEQ